MLPRGAERPKREFSCFCVARKGQKEYFRASAWRGKTKKRIFMLPRGAERPKKEVLGVTARRGKTKKRILGVTARRGKTKWRI